MSGVRWAISSALAGTISVGMLAAWGVHAPRPMAPELPAQASAIPQPIEVAPAQPAATPTAAALQPSADSDAGYYARLRSRLRWVQTRVGKETLLTPDPDSRMLLAKSAAKRARLSEVGLDFRDVYGLINAETSWVPRRGSSKDGTANLGIAQFEPSTARALGVKNPDDAVEAIHAAALHMREAAEWSRERLAGLSLSRKQRAEKLREGISVYYNLSTKGRSAWTGLNTDELPVQTQRHILNTRLGAQEALMLDAQLRAQDFSRREGIVTASGEDSRI